jgi:small subunit ribosomal protein S16
VATDSRNRRDGRFVENLGYFIPAKDVIVLKQDRIDYWLSVGARLTDVAKHLVRTARKRPVVATLPAEKRRPSRSAEPKAATASSKPQVSEPDGQASPPETPSN